MKKWNDWRELKYQIADKLFATELDEAYSMGIRAGAEYSTRLISFRVKLKRESKDLTKTQALGYEAAVNVIQDCKEEISNKTGAML